MVKMKVILPRSLVFNAPKLTRALENGLEGAAKDVQVDLQVTTQTWTTKPVFTIKRRVAGRAISTDDEIYGFVNDGTKPHVIAPRGKKVLTFGVGGSAKTAPRVIGSQSGSRGATIVRAKVVHHPGTEAREFDETIGKKWDDHLPVILQRAIDSEV
jgi:hypothetical protein